MSRREHLTREFVARFGPGRIFSAPARVNLIGEHTDYNDGFVLPMAIERRTYVAGAPRADRIVRARSSNLSREVEIDLDQPGPKRRGDWTDYIEGVVRAMAARGFRLRGADLLISSDVPTGAGLSSSAALEISLGYALARLSGVADVDLIQLALSGQAAEHEYVGTMCGIMDQYIAALAQRDAALLIDCRLLAQCSVPFELADACILVCDTRVKHSHASSGYNERRIQCEQGVAAIRRVFPKVSALRDIQVAELEQAAEGMSALIYRRCLHVVTENERTLAAAAALQQGDLAEVGLLMVQSHRSLRDDYEVSAPELDTAVDVALEQPGVFGARMTGGGFGGCTITLVERSAVERVTEALRAAFQGRFSVQPEIFTTSACDGVREESE